MNDTVSKEKEFWKWFLEREDKFYHFEHNQEELFNPALTLLQNIQRDLVFEIGPEIDGKREFIISANGLKEGFSSVIEVAKASPEMDRWIVVPFRQRKKNLDIEIQLGDLTLGVEDIFFTYNTSGNKVNLDLFIAGINPKEEHVYQVALLLLDNVIGEYDVEMKLDKIEIHRLTDVEDATRLYSLKELPTLLDGHFSKKVD
jgi:hypothetical protein